MPVIKSMNKHTSGSSKIVSIALIFAFLACSLLLIDLITPVSFDNEWREVRIPEGSNYTEGLRILEKGGIIKGRTALLFLGEITGSDKKLKPGYYNLSASMSPLEIFDTLIKGRTIHSPRLPRHPPSVRGRGSSDSPRGAGDRCPIRHNCCPSRG